MTSFAEAFVELRLDGKKLRSDTVKTIKESAATTEGEKAGQLTGKSWLKGMQGQVVHASNIISGALAGAAVAAGAESIKMSIQFQESMTTLVTGAGVAKKDLGVIADGVKHIAVITGTSTDDLVKAEYTIASAGFSGATSLNILKAAAEGAKTGNADLATTADVVTTVLKDYNLKGSDATKVTSQLVATVAHGKTHLTDLATALARVLPTASGLGIRFNEVAGAIATMTARGTSARLAAMGLNATIVAMSAPTEGAAKDMAILSLNTKDLTKYNQLMADGNTKAAAKIIEQNDASSKLSNTLTHHGLVAALQLVAKWALQAGPKGSAEYVKAMKLMLGGTNGLRVALQLTGKNMSDLVGNTKAVGAASGDAKGQVQGFAAVQEDAAFKLAKFKSEAQVTAINLGDKLLPAVTAVMDFISGHTGLVITLAGAFAGTALTISAVSKAYGIFIAVQTAATNAALGTRLALVRLAIAEKVAAFGGVGAVTAMGAALALLGFAIYKVVSSRQPVQQVIDSLAKANQAVGLNAAGYQRLSVALDKASTDTRGLVDAVGTTAIKYGSLVHASDQLSAASVDAGRKASNLVDTFDLLAAKYGITADQAQQLVASSHNVNALLGNQGKLTPQLAAKLDHYAASNRSAITPLRAFNDDLSTYNNNTLTATERTTALSGALQKFFDPAVAADQATIQMKNDQKALAAALAASGGKTGLLTQAQRDARSSFQTYIQSTADAAAQAFKASGRTSDYKAVIKGALPTLLAAAGDNKVLRAEIQKLIDTMKGMKSEKANIFISGSGAYTVSGGGGVTWLRPPGTRAQGGLLSGGTPGVDSVPFLGMPGEVVVPTHMVNAGAVDHLRGRLPGFAMGGQISVSGPPVQGSLSPGSSITKEELWLKRENAATGHAIGVTIAELATKAVKQLFTGGQGIAHFAYPHYLGVPYVWGGTSPTTGWDCSGAVQYWYLHGGNIATPRTSEQMQMWAQPSGDVPGAMVFFYGVGGNAHHVGLSLGNGQMINAEAPGLGTRMASVGGNSGFGIPPGGFDHGGRVPPGLSLMWNGTGRHENVRTAREEDITNMLLGALIDAVHQNAYDTAHGLAQVIGGAARSAHHASLYSAG